MRKMKVLKGIGLFFVYPAVMAALGFWGGIYASDYFYPGQSGEPYLDGTTCREAGQKGNVEPEPQTAEPQREVWSVSAGKETLAADTEYVLLETDILRSTEVETCWKLPGQYIGMDRETFLAAVENYSSFPPLSEKERGFVNAEVVSFARERVVIRMNYRYVQPGTCFYLAALNHEVVVYLEDKKTVYINTGIPLDSLPEELQLEIMEMRFVEDEGALYNFLETYSS